MDRIKKIAYSTIMKSVLLSRIFVRGSKYFLRLLRILPSKPTNGEEKSVTRRFGRKHDKCFYVIRRGGSLTGFFSDYLFVLGHLEVARQRDLIPVVDMEYFRTSRSEILKINGTRNSWEYYFKQPTAFSLSDAYKSRNYVFSSTQIPPDTVGFGINWLTNEKKIQHFNNLVCEYVIFNKSTLLYTEDRFKKTIPQSKKVIGVMIRGTDYVALRPVGHPIQPSVGELIEIVGDKLCKWGADYIYLVTEEVEAIRQFESAFPGMIICTDSMRYEYFPEGEYIANVRFERRNDRYLSGLEYLSDIHILSSCDYFVGAVTSGVVGAFIMNGNRFIDTHIIDLGLYT